MKTSLSTTLIILSTSSIVDAQIATRRRGKPTIVRSRILRGNPQQQQHRRVEKTSSAKVEKAASAKSAKMYKNTKSAKASASLTDAIQESPTALIAVSRYDENGKLITEYFDSPPEGYQLYLDPSLEAISTPLQDMMRTCR